MKTHRHFKLLGFLALAILALSLSPTSARAQTYGGNFTLPFQAHWGTLVLPPGDYSFTIDSLTPAGKIVVRRNGKNLGLIMIGSVASYSAPGNSALNAVPTPKAYRINVLRVHGVAVINFLIPKNEQQMPEQWAKLSWQAPVFERGE
jgi:hypothetical protein